MNFPRMKRPAPDSMLSTEAVARRLGIGHSRAKRLIVSGALEAVNVATDLEKRAVYRVTPEALARFIQARTVAPKTP